MYKKIWYRKGALAAIPWSTSLLGMVGLEGFVGDMLGVGVVLIMQLTAKRQLVAAGTKLL